MEQIKSLSNNIMSKVNTPSMKIPSMKIPSMKIPSIKAPEILQKTITSTTTNVASIINIKEILIIFGIFIFLVAISILIVLSGVSFKKSSKSKGDAYILEGIDGGHEGNNDELVKNHDENNCTGLSKNIDKHCASQLESSIGGKEKCNTSSCCVWIDKNDKMSGPMCLQGDEQGPKRKNIIKKLGIDEYYYKNKKHMVV